MKKKLQALAKSEWRSITRDFMLLITIFVPLLVAVFVRLAVPFATELLAVQAGFDLEEHHVFIVAVALLMTPMMLGALAGLQILDDRDERILSYISVTPLTREGYLAWRLFTPVVIGCVLTPLTLLVMGIVPLRLGVVAPVTLLAALGAPLYALLISSFASNKVEGLAVAKASGVIMWGPIAAYLLQGWWHLPAGLMPTYWPVMAFVAGYGEGRLFWVYIFAGVVVHIAWIVGLRFLFNRRAG
ncbi:MAG: hypothetical protein FH749_16150 [Firmicutes bacterium]|nr:hypothetical protein [Bacillota bacterium]